MSEAKSFENARIEVADLRHIGHYNATSLYLRLAGESGTCGVDLNPLRMGELLDVVGVDSEDGFFLQKLVGMNVVVGFDGEEPLGSKAVLLRNIIRRSKCMFVKEGGSDE